MNKRAIIWQELMALKFFFFSSLKYLCFQDTVISYSNRYSYSGISQFLWGDVHAGISLGFV